MSTQTLLTSRSHSKSSLGGRAPFSVRALRPYIFIVLVVLVAMRFFILATGPTSPAAFAALPQASTAFIRRIPLNVNDVVYSSSTQRLYASVPSSVGASGNSIVSLDPVTGSVDSPVFVGSEPKKLALSNDGNSLFVWLDGAASIRKFDVPTKTPGQQFPLGQDNFFGVYTLTDMAVAPGNANLLAVARSHRGVSPPQAGVAVFDNGVQRPTTTPGHIAASDFLAFSASPGTLYGGGFYSGLNTMTIDANGVSITSTRTFAAGSSIRFDNGLVYGSTGQVINPATGTLTGSFSGVGSGPFTTDSSVGRAYFITNSQTSTNYTVTLRAFDLTTFLPIGTLDITGVNGAVSSLVRWGSNGLVFRTDGGQMFLIQTSLIPSADPIPTPTPTVTPTPTPTPTPFAAFIRQVPLVNNDITYSSATQTFYAAVPSSVGAGGNSVQSIDPNTGATGNPVFIGSEPMKLVMADDGQTMYAALDGAGAIRRFNVMTQTADSQFAIGQGSSSNSPLFASDLTTLPGNPNAIAVSRINKVSSPSYDGVAVYDNGVRRTKVASISSSYVENSTNPNRLYSAGFGGVERLTLDATGVTYLDTVSMLNGGEIRFDNGLIYGTQGGVLDPEAKIMKGSFTGMGFSGSSIMTTDAANGRAYFLTTSFGGGPATLRAYDLTSFTPIGMITLNIPSSSFSGPTRLLRWGTNGLAFRIGTHVIFIQSELVSSSGAVPAPTPSPSPTPSPTPTPYLPTFIRAVDLPANDLVFQQATQSLYASVASVAGANGNSITGINPANGNIGSSVFVGSEPNRMALSDDDRTIHVSLDGAAAIRTFDLQTQTAGNQFSWGTANQRPADMAVVPASPQALALSDGTGSGVAIYDNGIARPNKSKGGAYGISSIAFGSTPDTLYGYDAYSSGFELVKLIVDSNGVTGSLIGNNLISSFSSGIQFSGGRLYSNSGRVVDPVAPALLGTFQATAGTAFTVDLSLHRIFYVGGNGNSITLSAFDTDTFLPVGSVTLAGITGTPRRLVRWGTNGLAFNVTNASGSNDPRRIYILQSVLVSNSGPIPTGLQLGSNSVNTFEGVGNLVVTVNRTGDVSSTTTVDYATSDGTAAAGSDYTASSGTITFAAGQLSRTITIPIINDNLYEGASETFNLTLTNPSGGAVLSLPTSATVTISDNESKPVVSIQQTLRMYEGASGTTTFPFLVSLSNPSVQTLTVEYTTTDGSALAGSDFVATSGTLTVPSGTTIGTINVTVNGDTNVEPDESFLVRLSNATNASFISTTQGTATILDDDGIKLVLDVSGPGANQVTAFDSLLFVRDPFHVLNLAPWLYLGADLNTRVTIFANNLTLNPGETASAVVVTLVGSNGQSHNITAEDVRPAPGSNFTQVAFRLPDGLPPGTCLVTIKAHGQTSNAGTIRIAP